jgi:Ca-activated chloride channel family protein
MHIATHLDIDVVAVEGPEQVSLLLDLAAPVLDPAADRPASTLVVVLDRSGSMGGERLTGAKQSLLALVDRLDPTDSFGLVTFDNEVQLVVPTVPLVDKAAVKASIARVEAGGSTDLAAGYLRGLQEARRSAGPGGATLVLISDGHANAGITDPHQLSAVAAKARTAGVTTTTLGFGLGYDETLLGSLARGGAGNELFAETADEAIAAVAAEVEGLLSQSAQAASLLIRMTRACRGVRLLNDMPAVITPDGVLVELGSFWSGEQRKLVLTFDIPGIAALGLAEVAKLDLSWVELPALVQHNVSVPVCVNVVPGDQAAGHIPDVVVRAEVAFQETQRAKKRASGHMSRGEPAEALAELRRARRIAGKAWKVNPADDSLREELDRIAELMEEAEYGDLNRAAKLTSADMSSKSRRRGGPWSA